MGTIIDVQDRTKAIEQAISHITKTFGKGSIMRLGEEEALDVQVISTGSLTLDHALGVGGLPRGRIIEIFGQEASGKTTLALHAIAEAQKLGGVAAFVDAEHALDPTYARKLGVNTDELLVSQPDTGEQALEVTDILVRSGAIDVIVIDSVAALVPKAELEGEMGDAQMGLQARLMSQALRKLAGTIHKTKTIVIFINQLRQKIGVFYGSPDVTTGGNALKFYASVRLDVRKRAVLKDHDAVVGNVTTVRVVKNKVAPPFREAEFEMRYGEGICRESELIDLAVAHQLINKSGSWYAYGETKLGQGKENAQAFLRENPALSNEIEQQIRPLLSYRTAHPTSGEEFSAEFSEAAAG
jgi:recombination protein RecA